MCCGWLQYSLENEKSERVGSASRKMMSSLAPNLVLLVSTVLSTHRVSTFSNMAREIANISVEFAALISPLIYFGHGEPTCHHSNIQPETDWM
jgi:hypothetical protein